MTFNIPVLPITLDKQPGEMIWQILIVRLTWENAIKWEKQLKDHLNSEVLHNLAGDFENRTFASFQHADLAEDGLKLIACCADAICSLGKCLPKRVLHANDFACILMYIIVLGSSNFCLDCATGRNLTAETEVIIAGGSIAMVNVFISYAEEDGSIAEEIAAFLEEKGQMCCWRYGRDFVPGPTHMEVTKREIEKARVFVIIVSRASIHSDFAFPEFLHALSCRPQPLVMPILIDITYEDLKKHQKWEQAVGFNVTINWSEKNKSSILQKIIKGIQYGHGYTPQPDEIPPRPRTYKKDAILSRYPVNDGYSSKDSGHRPVGRRRNFWLLSFGILLVVAALILTFRNIGTPSSPPVEKQETTEASDAPMVTIEAGVLHKGCWDDTRTVALLRKYDIDSGTVMTRLLGTIPRTVVLKSYSIDRFEVTNAQYREFLKAIADSNDHSLCHSSEPPNKDHTPDLWDDPNFNKDDQPVTGIDWFDAYAYAAWAGKRLPTSDEWEYAACGPAKYCYPWGNDYSSEKYLSGTYSDGPLPIGSVMSSRSNAPIGMAGNVAEWTSTPADKPSAMLVRGGTWNRTPGEVFALTYLPFYAEKDVRSNALGLRCAADDTSGMIREDMIRIEGDSVMLGGEESPFLNLLRRHSDITETLLRAEPITVPVGRFSIDKYEVTNKEYRRFLEYMRRTKDHSKCHPDEPENKDHIPEYWNDPDLSKDNQSVVGVDYYDAYSYAAWAGKRLPTGDEWERAAKGDSKNLYPWGNLFSPDSCICMEGSYRGPVDVILPTQDLSPYGIAHMAGNVLEWTSDSDDQSSVVNKLRGGAWSTSGRIYGLTHLQSISAGRQHRDKDLGFRCIADVPSSENEP